MSIFTYTPDKGFSKQTTPKVLTMQFGDGYANRIREGINSINTSWSLTFSSRSLTTAAAIISFLETAAGVTYFQWTPPNESIEYNVICKEWSEVYESHISRTITATFDRVYQT